MKAGSGLATCKDSLQQTALQPSPIPLALMTFTLASHDVKALKSTTVPAEFSVQGTHRANRRTTPHLLERGGTSILTRGQGGPGPDRAHAWMVILPLQTSAERFRTPASQGAGQLLCASGLVLQGRGSSTMGLGCCITAACRRQGRAQQAAGWLIHCNHSRLEMAPSTDISDPACLPKAAAASTGGGTSPAEPS